MILVTGANGTTGSEITRQLAAAGRPVRVLLRKVANAANLPKTGLDIALGSFEDVANVIDFFTHPSSEYITGQVIYLGGASC